MTFKIIRIISKSDFILFLDRRKIGEISIKKRNKGNFSTNQWIGTKEPGKMLKQGYLLYLMFNFTVHNHRLYIEGLCGIFYVKSMCTTDTMTEKLL